MIFYISDYIVFILWACSAMTLYNWQFLEKAIYKKFAKTTSEEIMQKVSRKITETTWGRIWYILEYPSILLGNLAFFIVHFKDIFLELKSMEDSEPQSFFVCISLTDHLILLSPELENLIICLFVVALTNWYFIDKNKIYQNLWEEQKRLNYFFGIFILTVIWTLTKFLIC